MKIKKGGVQPPGLYSHGACVLHNRYMIISGGARLSSESDLSQHVFILDTQGKKNANVFIILKLFFRAKMDRAKTNAAK